jgi:hypothetical protein
MLKKIIAPLLIVATALFTTVPPKVFAQTLAQPKAVASEHTLSSALVKPKPALRAVFANEIAGAKVLTLTAADYRRIDDKQQQQTSKPGWTKPRFFSFMELTTRRWIVRMTSTILSALRDIDSAASLNRESGDA